MLEHDLRDYFYYSETSPTHLRYTNTNRHYYKQDDIAGNFHTSGYARIYFKGRYHQVSRIIWAILRNNGTLPASDEYIVYLDDNPSNLSISNLRLVSNTNKRLYMSFVNGYKHVVPRFGKWRARIRFQQKYINLGEYDTEEEAIQVYNRELYKTLMMNVINKKG